MAGEIIPESRATSVGISTPTDPITAAYGIGKLAIEKYLRLYHHLHDLD